jgi:hypothetical protein
MATTTTNFGWDIPQSTDLVKDGATAIAALGQDIDTALVDLKGGTTGQVLAKASNTDLDFSWVAQDDSNAIQNAIVDAKGDLIAATAADTPARLAVGTNGQVLTADSAEATGLKWATSASGGMTLLSTTSLSGATTTISSISGSYKNLIILIKDFYSSSNSDVLMSVNGDNTAANYQQLCGRSNAASDGTFADNTTAGFYVSGYTIINTQQDNFASITIPDYANATTKKAILCLCNSITNSSAKATTINSIAYHGTVAAITSITIKATVGTWSAGSVEIYGQN